MSPQPHISIVLPARNEAANLTEMLRRLHQVLANETAAYEIIVVDDGSTDATVATVRRLRQDDARLRLIRLARNFGKEAALSCGLAAARGRVVATLDCDLQHPPEMLPVMLTAWREGAEIVMGLRQDRTGDGKLRRFLTRGYYYLMSRLSEIDIPVGLGDYNLYDRKVVDALLRLPERNRYMKGLVSWVGYKRAFVPVPIAPRQDGHSRFSLTQLMRFALVALTSFSNVPLKIWSGLGVVLSLVALGYGVYLTLWTIWFGIDVPGYASLMVAVLFLGGIQLISLGVIGEYLGRVFTEVKARPLYLEAEREGFDDDRVAAD
ncbi:MAG: glycosyltransferase family 2 protein [Alphaproteobacteria bacterium]